jgi:hypothetical protein
VCVCVCVCVCVVVRFVVFMLPYRFANNRIRWRLLHTHVFFWLSTHRLHHAAVLPSFLQLVPVPPSMANRLFTFFCGCGDNFTVFREVPLQALAPMNPPQPQPVFEQATLATVNPGTGGWHTNTIPGRPPGPPGPSPSGQSDSDRAVRSYHDVESNASDRSRSPSKISSRNLPLPVLAPPPPPPAYAADCTLAPPPPGAAEPAPSVVSPEQPAATRTVSGTLSASTDPDSVQWRYRPGCSGLVATFGDERPNDPACAGIEVTGTESVAVTVSLPTGSVPEVPRLIFPHHLGLSHDDAMAVWNARSPGKVERACRACDIPLCTKHNRKVQPGTPIVLCKYHWKMVEDENPVAYGTYRQRLKDFNEGGD